MGASGLSNELHEEREDAPSHRPLCPGQRFPILLISLNHTSVPLAPLVMMTSPRTRDRIQLADPPDPGLVRATSRWMISPRPVVFIAQPSPQYTAVARARPGRSTGSRAGTGT